MFETEKETKTTLKKLLYVGLCNSKVRQGNNSQKSENFLKNFIYYIINTSYHNVQLQWNK